MDTLPDMASEIVSDPVVLQDGVFCLQLGEGTVPLRMGGVPVESFVPGWRPVFAYTGFAPFILLQFENDTGEAAAWIINADGTRLGGTVSELTTEAREALCAAAMPRVGQFVRAILENSELSLDPASRAFLRLPERLLHEIGQLCGGAALPPIRRVVLDAMPDNWEDRWGLNRAHVDTLLATPFQDCVLQAVKDGMLSWPSPVDGTKLVVQGSLCSDDFRFAYRLVHAEHGLVCFPIVSDHHSRTLGLFVPALSLTLVRDSGFADLMNVYFPDLADWLVSLVCRFGTMLESYFEKGANQVSSILRGSPSNHLGHQLWNELTGIDYFIRSASGPHFPNWIVPGADAEIWGRLDDLFPQLQGHVDRSAPNPDLAIIQSYKAGICLVRITNLFISADLQASLRRSVTFDPAYDEIKRFVERRTQPDAPIILLGLRVENRTMIDLLEFCEELLEVIARTHPGTTIVIDGHNSGSGGNAVISHNEQNAFQSPLEIECKIAAHLKRLQVGRDVTVLDTLGASIQASLAWCEQATCFLSLWGASLAKYRWACNKSGFVITNTWSLKHRVDLHIYDSPTWMESPSHLEFVDSDLVEDVPNATALIDFGPNEPWNFNFVVKHSGVFAKFLDLLARENEQNRRLKDYRTYISCSPKVLYRDGGFFDPPELFAQISSPTSTSQNEVRRVKELYPSYAYVRPIPQLYTEDLAFHTALQAHYSQINQTFARGAASAIVCLTCAFVNSNVLYTKSGTSVKIVFETYRSNDRPYVPLIDPLNSLPSVEELSDDAVLNFYLGSSGSHNYGHWLVDDLPRARALETLRAEAAGRPIRIWITSASPVMDRMRVESLEHICSRIADVQVCFLKPNQIYGFRELYYVTPISYHPVLKSPEAMTTWQSQIANTDARLFVRRDPAHSRGLLNADIVYRKLEQRGFTAIDVESMSFSEQVDTFSKASIIVGCMGAAMANCVFAPRGVTTLYLAPQGWMEPFYWDAAAVLGHRYSALYGPILDEGRQAHLSHYTIKPELLDAVLDVTLGKLG